MLLSAGRNRQTKTHFYHKNTQTTPRREKTSIPNSKHTHTYIQAPTYERGERESATRQTIDVRRWCGVWTLNWLAGWLAGESPTTGLPGIKLRHGKHDGIACVCVVGNWETKRWLVSKSSSGAKDAAGSGVSWAAVEGESGGWMETKDGPRRRFRNNRIYIRGAVFVAGCRRFREEARSTRVSQRVIFRNVEIFVISSRNTTRNVFSTVLWNVHALCARIYISTTQLSKIRIYK